jgi:hypothetical protein
MITATSQPQSAEVALGTLLHLGKRARLAQTTADLGFILVNETFHLVPYRQAALWLDADGVSALSGVVTPQKTAPYVQWLERWCDAHPVAQEPVLWDLHNAAQGEAWKDWPDWLPAWLLAVPLRHPEKEQNDRIGVLLLAMEKPCTQAHLELLQEWAETWSSHYRMRLPRQQVKTWAQVKSRFRQAPSKTRAALAAALALVVVFPVDMSVLAPGELVPLEPAIIASPLDGVVQKVLVLPNERVKAGQPLLEFDRISLQSKLQVAQQALATVEADYRQRAQRAVFDTESKTLLAVVQSQLEEKAAEAAYLKSLNERGVVTAPRDGLVLFDDPNQWVGRPVVTGERIMVVADESRVAMEAWLAPADAVSLPAGSEMTLYLASDPLSPVQARLDYVSHVAQLRPDGQFAYKVRGALTQKAQNDLPRVGMKGTVKLHGETVPLVYRLIRRPWASFRAWVGW